MEYVVLVLRDACAAWFDSGYIFFVSFWMALEEFQIFLRGWVDSDPKVALLSSPAYMAEEEVAALVVDNGSVMPDLHLV